VEWLTDEADAERRRPGGIPTAITWKTTPALAQERLAAIMQTRSLRCRWVVADEALGCDPGFLEGVAGLGRWYVAEVPHSTRVWAERPVIHVPPWHGRGRRPPRARLGVGAPEARTVVEVAAALPAAAWTPQTIKAGRQGPMGSELACLRMVAVRDAVPGPESGWCCGGTSRRGS
jgi:SRSO17 transposase